MVNKKIYLMQMLLLIGHVFTASSDQIEELKSDIIIPADFQYDEKQLDLDQLKYHPEVNINNNEETCNEIKHSYFSTKNLFLAGGALTSTAGAFYLYRQQQEPTDFADMSHDQIQSFINQHVNANNNRYVDPATASIALKTGLYLLGGIAGGIGIGICYVKIKNWFQAPLEKRITDLERKITRTNFQNDHFEKRIIEIAQRSNEQDKELSRFAREHNLDREAMRQIRDRSNEQDQRLSGQKSLLATIIDRSDKQDTLIDETRRQLNNVIMHVKKLEEKKQ